MPFAGPAGDPGVLTAIPRRPQPVPVSACLQALEPSNRWGSGPHASGSGTQRARQTPYVRWTPRVRALTRGGPRSYNSGDGRRRPEPSASCPSLFADVVGSTAIGERLGPERSKFLFDEVIALIAARGAALRRHRRAVHRRRPVRALRRARGARGRRRARACGRRSRSRRRSPPYGDELRSGYGIELRVRVAVNTRPGRAHGRGRRRRERYNALGDTANVAARLQQLARRRRHRRRPRDRAPGAVLLRARVARRGRAAWAWSGPLRAARVTGARGPAQIRAVVPVVGRDGELAVLDEACQAIADGSGAILTITGEPGIGKSRLRRSRPAGASAIASASSRAAPARTPRASPTGRCATCCATGWASASTRRRRASGWS